MSDSERRHVFIVGCGFPQLGLVRAARSLGYTVTGADLSPQAIAVSELDYFIQASTGDVDQICSAFRMSGANGIVTSGSELALSTTVVASKQLGLPFYVDPETVVACRDKGLMRAAYRSCGLDVPEFERCTTVHEVEKFVKKVGLPVVIKPADGWGQRGVSLVRTEDELCTAFEKAFSASVGELGAVVEEFIDGHEIAVDGWVEDGTLVSYCVTDSETFPGTSPLGVKRSEISPSILDSALVDKAIDVARAGCKGLGLNRGPCYTQLAVSPKRIVIFETAARLGGGFDADVTRLSSGVDLFVRLLGIAFDDADLERSGVRHPNTPALVRFIAPVPGILEAVEGLDEVRKLEGVVDAAVYPRPGDVVEPLLYAAKRIGHILLTGATRQEAVDRAAAAEKLIRFVMRKQ